MSKPKNGRLTCYKEFAKPRLKKYKNPTVIPTIDAIMSEIERIALGRFEWTGIDGNGIAIARKVEEYLFYFKRCAIVDTNEVGLAVVKLLPIGVNIYGEPAGYDIITCNGVTLTPKYPRTYPGAMGQIGTDNAIILTDSQVIDRGCIDGMWHWIMLFADAQISLNQQMINQRAPLLGLTSSQADEEFVRVKIIDVETGLNGMIVDEKYGGDVKALNLDSQFNVDKINAMQHEYLSRALNSLGVDSMQAFGKKERMIVDEVESNDESLAMILSDCMKARNDPLVDNITAKEYGITCKLAKPYRISTYKENLITYKKSTAPAYDDNEKQSFETIDEVMERCQLSVFMSLILSQLIITLEYLCFIKT